MKKVYSNLILTGLVCFSVPLASFVDPQQAAAATDGLEPPSVRVVVIPLGGDKHYIYWQDAWTDNTAYKVGDGVQIDGSSYVCILAHTSLEFDNSPPDAAYWSLLAAVGATGADSTVAGPTGPTGATGADSTVAGPTGPTGATGADSTVAGPTGPTGATGADSTVAGPAGPTGPVGQAKGFSIGNEVPRAIGTETYIWLDRNLGASQVANSYSDLLAYGDLYQWGRGVDGHESRTSPTTTVLSSSDSPKHNNFILSTSGTFDWRDPQNDTLWQGESGINNPCPAGFRLPTEVEWNSERLAWVSEDAKTNDYAGAFASPLKLVVAGMRSQESGAVSVASNGYYWSSTVDGSDSRLLSFHSGGADVGRSYRANGFSVRCLKD